MFFDMSTEWAEVLRSAGLDDFHSLWELDRNWVEEPNHRRGGWSGVIRHPLDGNNDRVLFIKRQEGQNRSTWRHPVRGKPTYFLEYRFLKRFAAQFPQLAEWVCYAERTGGKQPDAAIMATRGLTNHRDLNEVAMRASRSDLLELLEEVAWAVLPLHLKRLQHGALYACHIFVHNETSEVKLIDMERARFRTPGKAAFADLSQFIRRTPWLDSELSAALLQLWEERFPGISQKLLQPSPCQPEHSWNR